MKTDSFLTSEELAQRWRVTTETIRRWIREDTIPHTRIGRRKLIPIQALEKLEQSKKQSILGYDAYYQNTGKLCTGIFTINSVLSSIVVYSHYLDSKTVTVYLTNLLFMGSKVYDVYNTVNTKPNIFYSAYLKNKVQFNDVDPDKVIVLVPQPNEETKTASV